MVDPPDLYSRRAISVRGLTYARMKTYCTGLGKTMSGFVEELVGERLDAAGVPRIEPPPERRSRLRHRVAKQSPLIEDGYVPPNLKL